MSEGDRLILKNMIERKYRTYAVQGHETIEDIMQARQLEMSEVEALNPGTDLDDLKAREIIKLPVHKYSAHEQYEMQGTFGSPQAFHIGSVLMNSVLAGKLANPSEHIFEACIEVKFEADSEITQQLQHCFPVVQTGIFN